MIYKTYLTDTSKLLSLPESGMGYQIIEGKLLSENAIRKYVVYNCELAIDLDEDFQIYRKQVINKGFANVLNESKSFLVSTDSIKLVAGTPQYEYRDLSYYKQTKNKRHSGGKGAKGGSKEYTKGDETFVRISAYENDKRIDINRRRLIEGSYTTTLADYYDCILTDDEPIDRYSLPNDEKVKWAFYIKPTSLDVLQRGIVQPAYGHEGGGIEVFFEKGTSDNTFYIKKDYGTL
jgi:hypothetical protein